MAKQMPKVYYGLHFVTGVAQYSSEKERIYIGEECAKQMDTTFIGKPVYVQHKDVNLERLQEEADGYVVESFYNPHDGKHWAKFVVVSDAGHEAIMNGWKLSNAYTIDKTGEGGRNHNIEFQCEVLAATYDHLAIVKDPRYEESVIMSPEDFKEYNLKKENELVLLKNSKEEESKKNSINQLKEKIMFKFFTKKEIENGADIENASVVLKNGKEVSVKDLVDLANAKNEAEELAMKEKEEKEEEEKKNAAEKEAKEKEEKMNSEKEAKEKAEKEEEEKKNAAEKEAKEKEEKMNEIKNAMDSQLKSEVVDISINQVARGQRLYGSNTK